MILEVAVITIKPGQGKLFEMELEQGDTNAGERRRGPGASWGSDLEGVRRGGRSTRQSSGRIPTSRRDPCSASPAAPCKSPEAGELAAEVCE
jgi:hypothetical protein